MLQLHDSSVIDPCLILQLCSSGTNCAARADKTELGEIFIVIGSTAWRPHTPEIPLRFVTACPYAYEEFFWRKLSSTNSWLSGSRLPSSERSGNTFATKRGQTQYLF